MIINYDVNNKGGGASAEGCLRYDQPQELTDEQQQQAKDNLGIEDPEPQAAVLYDQEQELTYAQKQQARTNIGAASLLDTVGWVGYNMEQMLTSSQQRQARSNIGAEAPRDGKTYGRRDWQWVEIEGGGEGIIVEAQLDYSVGRKVKREDLSDAIQQYQSTGIPIVIHLNDYSSGIESDEYWQAIYVSCASTGYKTVIVYNQASYLKFVIDSSSGEWIVAESISLQADWNETNGAKPSFIKNKPSIPQPENHQIVRNALASSQTYEPNEWVEVCRIEIPEDGAYQISSLVKPVKVGTVDGATINVALRQKRNSDVTELAEIELQPNRVTGCMTRAINALQGDVLVIESYSTVQYGIQAQPSVGKANATYLEAVRVGATYQS